MIEKKQLHAAIGKRIRKEREARNISTTHLSMILGITPGYLNLIERGQRGTTSALLQKLSNAFSLPIDDLFSDLREESSALGSISESQLKLNTLVSDFSEAEMDCLIQLAASIRKMKNEHPSE